MEYVIKQRKAQRSKQEVLCTLHDYGVFHELYQELEEELLYLLREGKKYGTVYCTITVVLRQILMRIRARLEDWYAPQCAQHEDYSYLLSREQSYIPLTQSGCGLMRYNSTFYMLQIAAYRKEAWMKALRSQTPPAYAVPRMPVHASHPLAIQYDSNFLGKEAKAQEEIYIVHPTGCCLFLPIAYRLNDSFIFLHLKQLETGGSVHISSPYPPARRKPSPLDTLD